VMYNKIETAYAGSTNTVAAAGAATKGAGSYLVSDQDVWSFILRAQRNFWP